MSYKIKCPCCGEFIMLAYEKGRPSVTATQAPPEAVKPVDETPIPTDIDLINELAGSDNE